MSCVLLATLEDRVMSENINRQGAEGSMPRRIVASPARQRLTLVLATWTSNGDSLVLDLSLPFNAQRAVLHLEHTV